MCESGVMTDDSRAYLAVMRLQRAYGDISTRRAWNELPSLATPDAQFVFDTRSGRVFEIDGAAAFVEFGARMTASFTFYEYIPLNFVVNFGPGSSARGRSYSLEVAEDRDSGDWLSFYGIYDDEYAMFEGAWRFARRRYRTFGRRRAEQLEAFPFEESRSS
jgi:SnoaL-like domain